MFPLASAAVDGHIPTCPTQPTTAHIAAPSQPLPQITTSMSPHHTSSNHPTTTFLLLFETTASSILLLNLRSIVSGCFLLDKCKEQQSMT